jgi:hypothetical protein
MKVFLIALLFNFSITGLTSAQIQISDSRDMQLGNASIACLPSYGISKNIAYIDESGRSFLSMNITNKYSINKYSPIQLSFIKSFNGKTSVRAGISKTGTNNFSEQYGEIGIAKKLGENFYAGIKLQYYIWTFNETNFENNQAIIPSAGFYAKPLKNLSFGVNIRNPVRSRMNAIEVNKLPAQINPGISLKVSDKIKLACSLMQENEQPLSTQFGAEYFFHRNLIFRCGWQTITFSQSFGFALQTRWMIMDFGIQTNSILGNSYSFSLSFPI